MRKIREEITQLHRTAGKSLMAAKRSGSGRMQEAEIMCPANLTVLPILSFRLLIVMFIRRQARRTEEMLALRVATESAQTRMSSTSLRAKGRPRMTLSDSRHQTSELTQQP